MAVSFALVHHANQFLITNGYETREGISDIVGSQTLRTGMLGLLALHRDAGVPLNLHISGTLLEAVSWHCPFAITVLRDAIREGFIELIGSCYGQNIMRFFSADYNLQQLNEELRLFEIVLGVTPSKVKVFWPPERVWDTKSMAPVLRDAKLLNDGYRYVILDDRTLLSPRDPNMSRAAYDEDSPWTPELYQTHEIEDGFGLIALPIGIRLRHSIPPKKDQDWQCVQDELEALLVQTANTGEANFLALYADDMEKVSGVWNADGPDHYSEFIQWLSKNEWVRPVKLSDWTELNPPASRRKIDVGTFSELAREFNAGEGYEKWFHSDDWKPYRQYFDSTEQRVKEAKSRAADAALIELAEKQLLVSNWETAWHTPATGAHGDPSSSGKPSPWARALTSHCRHALVTAEAACWFVDHDGRAHATVRDADLDGEPDLVLKNDSFFAVVSQRWGGRVVSFFYFAASRGAMAVGNPCDDWNFLEDLNKFMQKPRNHPGAFADVGFENDQYLCDILEEGERVVVRLINIEKNSRAFGLVKTYLFDSRRPTLSVRYHLPPSLKNISVECAVSPDYLALLRHGSNMMKSIETRNERGFVAGDIAIKIEPSPGVVWQGALHPWIGHGRTFRLTSTQQEFELNLRLATTAAMQDAA
jgi:Glycosyl hydrolase family 57